MKLDWRKITRKLILSESDNRHSAAKLIDQIIEQIANIKFKDQYQYMQLQEISDQIENLKTVTNALINENAALQKRVSILEENQINEFLD